MKILDRKLANIKAGRYTPDDFIEAVPGSGKESLYLLNEGEHLKLLDLIGMIFGIIHCIVRIYR